MSQDPTRTPVRILAITVASAVLATACVATSPPSSAPGDGSVAPSIASRSPGVTPSPTPFAPRVIGQPVFVADVTADVSRPSLAIDPIRNRVYVAWTTNPNETDNVSFIATSSDGGRTFGSPVQIPGRGEFWPVLKVTSDGTLVVAWTHWQSDVLLDPKDQYSTAGYQYVAKSSDGGQTLSAPVQVEHGGHPKVEHVYMNTAVSSDGKTISVSWFDYTPFSIPSLPQPGREAVTMWAATSNDGGATFGEPVEISANTCVCCMEAGVVLDGNPAFVFRGWQAGGEAGDIRNPTIVVSTAQGQSWSPPEVIHHDDYVAPECPHVGFGAVVDRAGLLHVTWWTGTPDRAGFWYTTSPDGAHFAEPVSLAPLASTPHENDAALGVDLQDTAWATTVDPGPLNEDGSADPGKAVIRAWAIGPDSRPIAVTGATVSGRLPQIGGLASGAILTFVDAQNRMMAVRLGS